MFSLRVWHSLIGDSIVYPCQLSNSFAFFIGNMLFLFNLILFFPLLFNLISFLSLPQLSLIAFLKNTFLCLSSLLLFFTINHQIFKSFLVDCKIVNFCLLLLLLTNPPFAIHLLFVVL